MVEVGVEGMHVKTFKKSSHARMIRLVAGKVVALPIVKTTIKKKTIVKPLAHASGKIEKKMQS